MTDCYLYSLSSENWGQLQLGNAKIPSTLLLKSVEILAQFFRGCLCFWEGFSKCGPRDRDRNLTACGSQCASSRFAKNAHARHRNHLFYLDQRYGLVCCRKRWWLRDDRLAGHPLSSGGIFGARGSRAAAQVNRQAQSK